MTKNTRVLFKATTAVVLSCLSGHALAHDGHGLGHIHWHATDALGFVVAAALVAVAVYFGHK